MRHLPDYIRGRGSSVINNSSRTARIYQKDNYFGRHVCVGREGGTIGDLRSYQLNDTTHSLQQRHPLRRLSNPGRSLTVAAARPKRRGGCTRHPLSSTTATKEWAAPAATSVVATGEVVAQRLEADGEGGAEGAPPRRRGGRSHGDGTSAGSLLPGAPGDAPRLSATGGSIRAALCAKRGKPVCVLSLNAPQGRSP
ncbi:peptidase inhibitor family I36 protein [Streptomyces griseofuscus]|uniref:peptidase inhibitor family I36 protein n=1 Tax=Streptomyces griseofuscus TaxID=146922 RepID=UPI0037F81A98